MRRRRGRRPRRRASGSIARQTSELCRRSALTGDGCASWAVAIRAPCSMHGMNPHPRDLQGGWRKHLQFNCVVSTGVYYARG